MQPPSLVLQGQLRPGARHAPCLQPTSPNHHVLQCGLSSRVLDVLRKGGFERPLAIQAQALPGEPVALGQLGDAVKRCWALACCHRLHATSASPAPAAPSRRATHSASPLPAVIMSGRDCIGIAKTGSGKTLAFVLPMLRHVKDQPALAQGDGPVALSMAPTRELVTQVGPRRCPLARRRQGLPAGPAGRQRG